jgi:type VI secretion system protein ImpJ
VRAYARTVDVPTASKALPKTPLCTGALKLVLVPQTELSGAYASTACRVIERRSAAGIARQGVVATTLACNSAAVPRRIMELHGLLRQRAGRCGAHDPARSRRVAEIADFLLLQVVNRYVGVFDHLNNVPRLHPERLYTTCVEMAGELSTFGTERRLGRPFPAYEHDDLQQVHVVMGTDTVAEAVLILTANL